MNFKKILAMVLITLVSSALKADQSLIMENQKSVAVKQQMNGEYPEMNREPSLPLASLQDIWSNAPKGSGIYIVDYDPRETIRLKVREYMTTTVVFPLWEKIKKTINGDESNYQISQAEENVIVIRPISYVGLDTSLTMIGESGHVYTFYVRTEGANSRNTSDITVTIRVPGPLFAKNATENACILNEERTDYLEEAVLDSSKLNFKFSMSGDETIAPDLVYSDGVRTWFDYGDNLDEKRIPTFYSVIDGYQQALNVTIDGTRLVAHGSGSFVLKSGDRVTCVYPTKEKKKA